LRIAHVHLLFDFFSDYRQILRRFNADAHYALGYPDHSYRNIIPDKDFFADFSRKYKHGIHRTKQLRKTKTTPFVFAQTETLYRHHRSRIALLA
jgi:hypothetical protein